MLLQMLTPHWWLALAAQWGPWYVMTLLLGLLVFPFLFSWLRSLPDRGYAVSRITGAFLITYLNWVLCHRLMQFSPRSLAVSGALLAALSLHSAWRHFDGLKRHFREHWRWLLATELLALFLFMVLVNIRSHCADIQYNPSWHGAEKLGNMMMLTSLMRTGGFPAEDAWFCGSAINYYYGGHLQWATLGRVMSLTPQVTFNLALATLFSWIGLGAFGLMLNLTRRIMPSILCAIILVFAGNLEPFRQIPHMQEAYHKWRREYAPQEDFEFGQFMMVRRFDLWRASRVILSESFEDDPADYTVNEFPWFSFILGDLHAHSSSLPLTLVLLNVLLSIYYRKKNTAEIWWQALAREPAAALLIGALIGGVFFYNSWEIIPLALLMVVMLAWDRDDWRSGRLSHAGSVLASGLVLAGIGLLLLFGLFTLTLKNPWSASMTEATLMMKFKAAMSKVILRPYDLSSSARKLFIFWGLVWLPLGLLMLEPLIRKLKDGFSQKRLLILCAVVFALALQGMFLNMPGAQICTILLLLAAIYAWRRDDPGETFATRLALAGFLIVCIAEIVVIDDAMTGRLERYNTVFKLYYPAWAHLTIAAVFLVWRLDQNLRILPGRHLQRVNLWFVIILLLGLGMVYPLMATWSRTDGLFSATGDPERGLHAMRPQESYRQRTLDGLAFLDDATESPDDLALIRWLQQNVQGRPRILEAAQQAYSYTGRVSAFTGLPTIIGWDNHEKQWRGWDLSPQVDGRKADVETAYSTTDPVQALEVFSVYGIQYVIVGKLERSLYAADALAKFESLVRKVFQSGNSAVYQLDPAILAGQLP